MLTCQPCKDGIYVDDGDEPSLKSKSLKCVRYAVAVWAIGSTEVEIGSH
jgi:hypothetical protein